VSDIVIKAENLGKKYTIGHQAEKGRYLALRDVLVQNARKNFAPRHHRPAARQADHSG
jgi:lipopolysaccharide transport system ATP-binding protein